MEIKETKTNKIKKEKILKAAVAIILIMAIGYGIGFLTLSIINHFDGPSNQNSTTNVIFKSNDQLDIINRTTRIKLPPIRIH